MDAIIFCNNKKGILCSLSLSFLSLSLAPRRDAHHTAAVKHIDFHYTAAGTKNKM